MGNSLYSCNNMVHVKAKMGSQWDSYKVTIPVCNKILLASSCESGFSKRILPWEAQLIISCQKLVADQGVNSIDINLGPKIGPRCKFENTVLKLAWVLARKQAREQAQDFLCQLNWPPELSPCRSRKGGTVQLTWRMIWNTLFFLMSPPVPVMPFPPVPFPPVPFLPFPPLVPAVAALGGNSI